MYFRISYILFLCVLDHHRVVIIAAKIANKMETTFNFAEKSRFLEEVKSTVAVKRQRIQYVEVNECSTGKQP